MDNKNKIIILLVIIIVVIASLGVYIYFSNEQLNTNGQTTSLTGKTQIKLYSSESSTVASEVESLRTIQSDPSYGDWGYNNETLDWLDGLQNYVYFMNDVSFIIMTPEQAQLLPDASDNNEYDFSEDGKSTINYNIIECDIIETHSLGSGLKNCILVDNVKFVKSTVEEK